MGRFDAALRFLTHSIARESRVNMGAHLASAKTISAASYSVTANDCGYMLLCVSGAFDQIITLPLANAVENGFTVAIRKSDTGTGRVIVQTASKLATLYQQRDEVVLMSDGATWHTLSFPKIDRRPELTMPAIGTTIQINARENGRFAQINQSITAFTGATTDNRIIELVAPFTVGDVYYIWLNRDGTAGTKTLNFTAAGMTIRRSWGTGAFSFTVNQRHRFIAEVVAQNEIHIIQTRIQP